MRNISLLLRQTWPAFLLLAAIAVLLPGCGSFSYQAAKEAADVAAQESKPRLRVKTLATSLKETQEGLGQASLDGLLPDAELLAAKAGADRARAFLKQAGDLLDAAASDDRLADVAEADADRVTYQASARINEGLALSRSRDAEAELKPLRALLARVRGQPMPIAPARVVPQA